MKEKIVFGIETSCDDTSFALVKGNPDDLFQKAEILSHHSFSQEELLAPWGGVVPEIAARNHLDKIVPLLNSVFKEAQLKMEQVDLIGVTTHPGLLGPLLTGVNCAKTLSLLYKLPILPVNHLYAHLEAIHLSTPLPYPYLGLLVSGGHSMYLKVTSPSHFEIIGNTVDDAAGEAFDKGGKLMGLGYPAGKKIDELAKNGDSKKYKFPISMLDSKNAMLSFSGVKTSLKNFIDTHLEKDLKQEDVCASYQYAIVEALSKKLKVAQEISFLVNSPIVVGGGVACNSSLRKTLSENYQQVHFVLPKFCTDNGAMIANYALRTFYKAIAFPESLKIDAGKGEKF